MGAFVDSAVAHATLILVLVVISLIVLIYEITANAVLMNAVKAADPSGFSDGLRGLGQFQLASYCVSLVVMVAGGVLLLTHKPARDIIAADAKKFWSSLVRTPGSPGIIYSLAEKDAIKSGSGAGHAATAINMFGGPSNI